MGDVSRRAVLGAGVAAAGVVALGVGEGRADAATSSTTVSHVVPSRSTYAKSLGKTFTAKLGGHSYGLQLKYIHDLPNTTAKQRARSFVLVFASTSGVQLHDGIYVLRSAAVGAHNLFISAVGTNHGMQAVVNRTR